MEKVIKYISNAPFSQEVIEKDNLKLEALSNLSRSQVKNLRIIIVIKGMLSTESVSYIQEHAKDVLGSSDEGAGNSVISDSEEKENDVTDENDESVENDESGQKMTSQMKVMRQCKMMSQMKVEGMFTNSV